MIRQRLFFFFFLKPCPSRFLDFLDQTFDRRSRFGQEGNSRINYYVNGVHCVKRSYHPNGQRSHRNLSPSQNSQLRQSHFPSHPIPSHPIPFPPGHVMFVLLFLDEVSPSIMIKFTYPKRRFVELIPKRRREGKGNAKRKRKKREKKPQQGRSIPFPTPRHVMIMNRLLSVVSLFNNFGR